MILSFKKRFTSPLIAGWTAWQKQNFEFVFKQFAPTGTPPKIHTIRADKADRWRKGRKIHFWIGSPRNPRKKPYCARESLCTGVQSIQIGWLNPEIVVVRIDGRTLSVSQMRELAINDGFSSLDEFFGWFSEDFEGKLIHWTDKRY